MPGDFVHHSTLGLTVRKEKKKGFIFGLRGRPRASWHQQDTCVQGLDLEKQVPVWLPVYMGTSLICFRVEGLGVGDTIGP